MSDVVPGATPPVATPAPVAQPDPAVTATPEPEAPKPERTFTQAELDAAIEKRLAKERRKRHEIEIRAKVAEELALKKGGDQKPENQPQPTGEPKREQFDTYEAYIEARAEWKAEQKIEAKWKERDTKSQEDSSKAEQQKRAEDFRKRTKELAKEIKDFDEVMAEATSDPEAPVSRLFAEPINECDNPAAVLYHLAKNPEEAERIASLGAHKQAREIWALEAKLKAEPPPKKPSNAPEPIAPVGGKVAAGDKEPDAKTNPQGWYAWRQKQAAKRKA